MVMKAERKICLLCGTELGKVCINPKGCGYAAHKIANNEAALEEEKQWLHQELNAAKERGKMMQSQVAMLWSVLDLVERTLKPILNNHEIWHQVIDALEATSATSDNFYKQNKAETLEQIVANIESNNKVLGLVLDDLKGMVIKLKE